MFLIALAFLVGHCVVHALPGLPQLWPWLGIGVISALIAVMFRARWCIAFILGVIWAWSNAAWRLADQLPSAAAVDVEVRGRIASIVDIDDAGIGFVLDVLDADKPIPSKIQVSWYETDMRPAAGELWQLVLRIKPPRGFANPGGSDYSDQQFRNGMGAVGYVRASKHNDEGNMRLGPATWRYSILRIRAFLSQRLAAAVPTTPMLGIVQGLAVGDTQGIPSAQWRVFANTGTTHLMAISGLHIGMVAALIAWLAGRLCWWLPLQRWHFAVSDVQCYAGMTAALAYSALAGFSVPTQRTLVMLLVYFGTRLLRRKIPATQGLAIALFGVLLIDPFAPLSPGFWLSFGAVSAIFLSTGGRLAKASRVVEYLSLQAAVSIGLLPFLIGAFGALSVISPLVNLAAIPFFTFLIVPIVLLGSLLLVVNTALGTCVVQIAVQLLEWGWRLLEWASGLPWAMWHLPQLPSWIAALLMVGCLLAIAPGILGTRVAGAMLCLPALLWEPVRPSLGAFDIAVLDVGQGLSVVVRTQSHVMVYDTGPSFRSGRDTGEMVVLPYLYSRGIRHIDTLMLTHGDNDHVGGARSVMAGLPISRILTGPSVHLSQQVEHCEQGQQWRWDNVEFTIVHPTMVDASLENNSSCVVRIAVAGASGDAALLLGDIEHEVEARLVASGAIRQSDIVVVPHHGSRTSSTALLTGVTVPKLAIVSAGYGNRWGFPKADVVERWHAVGARILNTADSGAIEIDVEAPKQQAMGMTVREYRERVRAYWRN